MNQLQNGRNNIFLALPLPGKEGNISYAVSC